MADKTGYWDVRQAAWVGVVAIDDTSSAVRAADQVLDAAAAVDVPEQRLAETSLDAAAPAD